MCKFVHKTWCAAKNMKADLCSIPVSEVFSPRDGCPLCRLRDLLERRAVEYITGAAMMEPDVRMETNRAGFCHRHFEMMLESGSRLSIALLIESHLSEIQQEFHMRAEGKQKKRQAPGRSTKCFVCGEVERALDHMLDTVFHLWQTQPEFRSLYREQPCFCLPHARLLMYGAADRMPRRNGGVFIRETAEAAGSYLSGLKEDVTQFCSMYDYRNRDGDWSGCRDAVERSIHFLTSRPVKKDGK